MWNVISCDTFQQFYKLYIPRWLFTKKFCPTFNGARAVECTDVGNTFNLKMSRQLRQHMQEFPSCMDHSIILIKSFCSESQVSGATKLPNVTNAGVHFKTNSLTWKHRLFFGDCNTYDRPTRYSKYIHKYYFHSTFHRSLFCKILVQMSPSS